MALFSPLAIVSQAGLIVAATAQEVSDHAEGHANKYAIAALIVMFLTQEYRAHRVRRWQLQDRAAKRKIARNLRRQSLITKRHDAEAKESRREVVAELKENTTTTKQIAKAVGAEQEPEKPPMQVHT